MTEHDAREVTTERRPVMDPLLLHVQAWWDAQRFDQREWQVAAWREQKLRHIQLHVAKALGKVVTAVYKNFKRTFCHPAARTPQSSCCGMEVRTRGSTTSPR
jgi:hypothetical protein